MSHITRIEYYLLYTINILFHIIFKISRTFYIIPAIIPIIYNMIQPLEI